MARFNNIQEIIEFIESFNNAVYKGYLYNELDGQEYIYFEATIFAKNGICRELNRTADLNMSTGRWKMCIS